MRSILINSLVTVGLLAASTIASAAAWFAVSAIVVILLLFVGVIVIPITAATVIRHRFRGPDNGFLARWVESLHFDVGELVRAVQQQQTPPPVDEPADHDDAQQRPNAATPKPAG